MCLPYHMEETKDQFLEILYDNLQELSPCKEYDLLMKLRDQGHTYFVKLDLNNSLELFKAHYLLFHLLYQLKEKLLLEKKASLNIHCTMISLEPYTEEAATLAEYDYIKGYYSDLSKLETFSKEETDSMINDFWKRMAKLPNENEEALEVLNLSKGASDEDIKVSYKKLALIHHPDRGGTKEDFQKIVAAKKELIG